MASAAFVLRSILVATFGVAAVAKMMNMPSFATTLEGLGLPRPTRMVTAWGVVLLEAAVALALAVAPAYDLGAWLASALVLGFAAASLRAIQLDQRIHCSCFGRGETTLGVPSLIRAVLLQACVVLFWMLPHAARAEWPTVASGLELLALSAGALLLGRYAFAAPGVLSLMRSRRMPEPAADEAAG